MAHIIEYQRLVKLVRVLRKPVSSTTASVSRSLCMSRQTIRKYNATMFELFRSSPSFRKFSDSRLAQELIEHSKPLHINKSIASLDGIFRNVYKKIGKGLTTIKATWLEYLISKGGPNQGALSYSSFNSNYVLWRKLNNLPENFTRKWAISWITKSDEIILRKWKRSNNRRMWERATVILEVAQGMPISVLEKKVERSRRKIIRWIKEFKISGVAGVSLQTKKDNAVIAELIRQKKERLLKLIHEPPSAFGINRTSWRLADLSSVYTDKHGEPLSSTTIRQYLKEAGYSFKKAKKVLTSPDPQYREKLKKITKILSHLSADEAFFSVDEFGPFSVKAQGGRAFAAKGIRRTYPQWQKSKGKLILTAALELSSNQITFFYSDKKNTEEMIKLMFLLLDKYKSKRRIYLSWDAASWHMSKKLFTEVSKVNSAKYRDIHSTPVVRLAPLPSSAQFLNVIESVFSGLARSIIHNSNYESLEACKAAINRYFLERNDYFLANPKRAGQKIWGKELTVPVFNEANNCKDPAWR